MSIRPLLRCRLPDLCGGHRGGGVEAVYADESIWLTQNMMGVLYDVETHATNYQVVADRNGENTRGHTRADRGRVSQYTIF